MSWNIKEIIILCGLIKNTDGCFLHQYIFSKMHYKHVIYSDILKLLLIHSDNALQAPDELRNNSYDCID